MRIIPDFDYCDGCDRADCQDCCTHDETDHGICLDCEKDLSPHIGARAFDASKDLRKYGDL